MADAFLGLTMLVTLSAPAGAQLRGKVSSIVAGQSLTLRDVYCPNNGQTISEITIRASDILDLVEAPNENTEANDPLIPEQAEPTSKAQTPRKFEDPAILSMRRKPTVPIPMPLLPTGSIPQSTSRPSISSNLPQPRRVSGATTRGEGPETTRSSISHVGAVPVEAIASLALNVEGDAEDSLRVAPQAKRTRPRRNKSKSAKQAATIRDSDIPLPVVTETNRAKGWRQTPLLEPNPSFQPFTTLKKKSRGKTYDNGWATEDATDVQDMGEFDFQGNLSKFDKHTVFEGLRAEDMTADEDRLVGHNRLARPGTNGGKNLHPLENVLDGVSRKTGWNSEADDSEMVVEGQRGSQRDTGSGRNSRRGQSQLRRPISRKETSVDDLTSLRQAPSVLTGFKGAFYTLSENKRCDTISALQMLNLENIADSEFSLSEDMMTENAGRGIAELANSVTSERGRSGERDAIDRKPSVVVLAGDNKSGLRAVAAGRHLRNHGMDVVVCILGLNRESDLLVGLRRQLKAFRSFGGKVFDKIKLMEYVKTSLCDLIIDGLLGLTMAFEELGTGDQATAYELIEWANRSNSEVMAIDIPTGIDPSSGKVSIIDGRPLHIHPTYVVAMGAAKKGLLQAMQLGEGVTGPDSWRIWVADVGIASLAWKKAGTRMRRGMEFDKQWAFEIYFKVGAD